MGFRTPHAHASAVARLLPSILAAGCIVLAPTGTALAQESEPSQALRCAERDGGVHLEWNIAFFAPIEAFVISRDGEPLAKLPPSATSYFDEAPPPGEHVYTLGAVNLTGERLLVARCAVTVPAPGLRCSVEENQVKLSWGPILIDVLILEFRITRNGEEIATVPPDQLSYVDTVLDTGGYVYKVYAVTGPDSELLVGACRAHVTCFGLKTEVSGLDVSLSWEHVPIPLVPLPSIFVVSRDGVAIARTEVPSYKDTVPAPGRYVYRVDLVYPDSKVPDVIIGECIVVVPGPLPPPLDLRCAVLSVEPAPIPIPIDTEPLDPSAANATGADAIDSDGDGIVDAILPRALVALRWTNPIAYDKIVISRNGAVIATIPGDETRYVDRVRAGGVFTYEVEGTVGNISSPAASCTVEIPPPFIPPPQDFTCRLVDWTTADPGDDPSIAVPTVVLRWWNPIEYRSITILRDGAVIAELPGDAMGYRDAGVPPGSHLYGIYGVARDGRRSRVVECKVGGEPVPPVEDLQCAVALAGDLDPATPGTSPPLVVLRWRNPIAYDAILIGRDGQLITRLPGTAETFTESGVPAGEHIYQVFGVLDGQRSPPKECRVTVPGRRNRLHFTRGLIEPAPVLDDNTPEPLPGNRITCLADCSEPIQGWSFGVASDPKVIVPRSTDLDGTATAALNGGSGPAFLVTDILADGSGVTMAVLVDESAPFETLPAGNAHRILNIEYKAGPEGRPGESYAVRYSSRLGSPPVQVLFVVGGFEVVPATAPGRVSLPGIEFQRGDSNGDGFLDMSDAVHALNWLFLGGEEPGCLEAANANGGDHINIADPIYLLMFLFDTGGPPPPPFPGCGFGPTPNGCLRPGECPRP